MRIVLVMFSVVLMSFCTIISAQDWRKEADERIEKHRKNDIRIIVTKDGVPLEDAEVRIEQLRHEFLFGCNIFKFGICSTQKENDEYLAKFTGVMNFATLPFYWWFYEPERGKPEHANREYIASWCNERDIETKGHPLAWNFLESDWLKKLDPDTLFKLQIERIDDCVGRFKGKIDTWDVVNELSEFTREECERNAPALTAAMKKIGGDEATRQCFEAARKANPDAKLLINDYITDDRYVKVIESLTDENGKPIYDIIGIQSHMHSGAWSNETLLEVCERFSKFGVPLHFTELTILSGKNGWELPDWPSTSEGEKKQAEEVERVYTMLFSHPSVEAITWWDLSDQGAWMKAPAGLIRKDMSAKPAYDVLDDLVNRKWKTDLNIKTDKDGSVKTRVFRGRYAITVELKNGKQKRSEHDIMKKDSNEIRIEIGD